MQRRFQMSGIRGMYELRESGEYLITVPADELANIVGELLIRGIVESVTVGSVHHLGDTPLNFLLGATPERAKKSSIETFLRKHGILNPHTVSKSTGHA